VFADEHLACVGLSSQVDLLGVYLVRNID